MKKEGRREEMNYRFWGAVTAVLVLSVMLGADEPPTAPRGTYLPDEVIVKLRAAGTLAGAGTSWIQPLSAGPGVSPDPWARFRSRISIRGVRQLRQAVSPVRRPRRSSTPVPHSSGKSLAEAAAPDLGSIYRLKVALQPNQSLDDIIALLQADSAVEYAERNQRVFLHTAPNDPYYPQQWALRNTGQAFPTSGGGERTGTAGADIGAEQAWDAVANATEVVVAVVDSGVDYTHRDLANRMWINTAEAQGRPGVDDDGNGYIDDVYGYNCADDTNDPMDDYGHGTFCAGIIGAESNNGMDIAGICPSARIMAVRNLGDRGGGDTFTSAEAIYYAVANGADVISCSWGSQSYSETERRAVEFARRQGVLVIASAGNAGADRLQYPASWEAVISVAATDANDRRAEWSTYGDWVDIAAPGVLILSLRAAHTDLYTDNKDYVPGDRFVPFGDPNATLYLASGTSMAAPVVAGVAALAIAQRPEASLDEIRDRLLMAADDLSDLNPEYVGLLGSGRVNAFRAVSPTFRGLLTLDRPLYHGQDQVQIQLIDFDLAPGASAEVDLSTDQGDRERVLLARDPERPWLFAGTIRTGTEALLRGDGILQVGHDESLTARYADQADEQGQVLEISASAVTDIVSPRLESIHIETSGASPHTTIQTDEPTTVRILAVATADLPEAVKAVDLSLSQDHSLVLADIADNMAYALVIELTDQAGNVTRDDNNGGYYRLNTEMAQDAHVPSQYPTIQEGIDSCWPGRTVWVADGIYTGTGNRDLDLRGKAIAVRSENGPENCILDCQGSETEPHRGFLFQNHEGPATILSGFTITNGCTARDDNQAGGAILCESAGPLLENCIFRGNRSYTDGGAVACYESTLQVERCVFWGNRADRNGGALYAAGKQLHLHDCSFSANVTGKDGGVFIDVPTTAVLTNCSFSDNRCEGQGAGAYNDGSAQLINCVFSANRAPDTGSAYYNYYSSSSLTGCVFARNGEPYHASGPSSAVNDHVGSMTLTDCLLFENWGIGLEADTARISMNQCQFLKNGGTAFYSKGGRAQFNRCVIGGNRGPSRAIVTSYAGTFDLRHTTILGHQSDARNPALDVSNARNLTLTHSILWDNGPNPIRDIQHLDPNGFHISYCDIQGGAPGEGNIDADPLFVASGSSDPLAWDLRLQPASPCIDAGVLFPTSGDYGQSPLPLDGNADGVVRSDMGAYEFEPLAAAPVIAVNVPHLDFVTYQAAGNPADQTLRLHNAGNGILQWRLELDPACPWLRVAPVLGQAPAGQMDAISVGVDTEDTAPGDYQADLTIVSDAAANSPVVVPVQLHLSAPLDVHVPAQFSTIQAAIDAVEPGGRIIVSPGCYRENLRFPGKDIVLCSVNPLDPNTVAATVIDGNQVDPVVTFWGNETPFSRLEGLTITGGRIAPVYRDDDGDMEEVPTGRMGAGISGNGTHATITRCVIKDNTISAETSLGAGIADCDGLIDHCTIKNNSANGWDSFGGGLWSCDGTISNCVIADNYAYESDGGLSGCSGRITDCLIKGNVADDRGGGVGGASGGIFNCVISGNTCMWDGGGLQGVSGPIVNCLIAGNRCWRDGAGVADSSGPISHCTIVGNVSGSTGGGIGSCTGAITNCIIVSNRAEVEGEQLWGSETPSYSCFPGAVERGNLDIDPGFVRAGSWDPNGTPWDFLDDVWTDGDYHLSESSGCIDAGTNLPDVTADFTGTPRPVDGNADGLSAADMGCYEWNPLGRSVPVLEVESRAFAFAADADGPAPATQFLRLRNWGSGGLPWRFAENCAWLTVTPTQGQAGVDWTALELSANQAGLEPGDYSCTLEIQSEDAVNGPSRIEIALHVQGPELGVCPRHLEWTLLEGQSLAPAVLSVRNLGSGIVHWQLYHDSPWLGISQSEGDLAAAQAERVDVDVNVSGFAPGRYQTSLRVSDDVGEGHEQVVPVIVNVVSRQFHVPQDYPTIQSALDAATDGCTVVVADGTYTGPGNRQLRFRGKALTLQSENGPAHCIIDCEQQAQGFRFEDFERADSVLEGFTILNGRGDLGGGILISRASPTIRNCHILHCQSDQGAGGGIYAGAVSSSIWTVEGIFIGHSSWSLIESCVISYNTADDGEHGGRGGGICLDAATSVEVRDCVISSNVAAGHGGDGPTEAYAGVGGGVFCGRGSQSGATLGYDDQLTRCVITDNTATWGAAVAVGKAGVGMDHCTVANNTAGADGGGLYAYNPPRRAEEIQLDSCIFWSNSPNSLRAVDQLQAKYSDLEDARSGIGNLNTNPRFVNSDNPIGLDNEWLTRDDGLVLHGSSPCRRAGYDHTHMGAYQY
jgi:thermitase